MRGQIVKAMRQQASRARDQAIGAVSGAVTAAFTNEELTRKRVEALEKSLPEVLTSEKLTRKRVENLEQRMSEAVIHRKSLLGRLRWLFLGK